MSITDNVKAVKEQIAHAAESVGRLPEDIMLVAATKMNGADAVREAIRAGVDACGENRVQELMEKNSQDAYRGAALHFIGHLQRNKVKDVVGVCNIIESADSEELISLLGRRAVSLGITQDILIEINIGGEKSKSGVKPEEIDKLLDFAAGVSGITVKGLMAIPPVSERPGQNRKYFDRMYNLFVDIKAKKHDNINMRLLSMGMSADYTDAIMSGANVVRVGTAIFGERHYR